MFSRPSPTSSFLLMVLAVGALVAGGIVLSNFQREAGVAEASPSSISAVASAEDAARILREPTEYAEYEAAVRVATVAHDRIVLFSPVDNDVRLELGNSLAYLELARQAWQAQDSGEWETTSFSDPLFLQARLPGLDTSALAEHADHLEVLDAAARGAEAHLAKARDDVGM